MAFGFLCTFFVHLFITKVESYLFFTIPFLGGTFVFFIFNFLLKKFIQHRLAIIYRSIQTKQEHINAPYLDESLDEMIENAEEKIEQWKDFQTKEISKLKDLFENNKYYKKISEILKIQNSKDIVAYLMIHFNKYF